MSEPRGVRQVLEALGPQFELVRELGRGTTSVVYLVRDVELGRDTAVKVIRPAFVDDEEAAARLQREARLVAQLHHPNIVRVYGTRQLEDGSLGLLMEHVPGRNLKELLREEGPLSTTRALRVLSDVASALAYAHRRRIVHRDVKPENIYLDEEVGAARLADFGVARPWDMDAGLTLPGMSLGTPAYMSPEQIEGKELDARSDIYSLGLVGYEALVGHHPWESENLFGILYRQKNEELPPLAEARPDAPAELVSILERALHKDASERWVSSDAMLSALQGLSGSPAAPTLPLTGGRPPVRQSDEVREEATAAPPPPAAPSRRVRRFVLPAAMAAALVLSAAGLLAWVLSVVRADNPFVEAAAADVADPDLAGVTDGFRSMDAAPGGVGSRADGVGDGAGGLAAAGDSSIAPGGSGDASTAAGASGELASAGPLPAAADEASREDAAPTTDPDASNGGGDGAAPAGPASVRPRPADGADGEAPAASGADVLAAVPASIARAGGGGQSAPPTRRLPGPLAVQIVDGEGNVLPGAVVRFDVTRGGGRTVPSEVRTDSQGWALARWTLGPDPGPQEVVARVVGAEGLVESFAATAAAPAAPEPARTPDPAPGPDPLSVRSDPSAVGGTHVCTLDGEGAVSCRGADERGQVAGSGGAPALTSLAAGVSHTCGLGPTGRAYCWGANESGQLGDGSRVDRSTASRVGGDERFAALAGGVSHTCALERSGRVFCWGRNLNGQLGDGSRDDRTEPRPVAAPRAFARLAVGWNHSCAVGTGGSLHCWGLNSAGQLGDGTHIDRLTPTPVPEMPVIQDVAAGSAHTCALTQGGDVLCWGDNQQGQLGTSTGEGGARPSSVEGLPGPARLVTAGALHTCALTGEGEAWCWGHNAHGQLGNGGTVSSHVPAPVTGGLRFRSLEAGGAVTCGATMEGARYCWGLNQHGQLDASDRTNRSSPMRMGG